MAKLKTYIIEEVASYYLKAKTRAEADRIFLGAISLRGPLGETVKINCEINHREVYADPENREV